MWSFSPLDFAHMVTVTADIKSAAKPTEAEAMMGAVNTYGKSENNNNNNNEKTFGPRVFVPQRKWYNFTKPTNTVGVGCFTSTVFQ